MALELVPGAQVGQYRIVEQVGRGGMATVYKAFQPALDRYVAVKVLPAFYAESPSFLQRFRQEARAVSSLRHPNILTVFDYGEQDGVTYMVSEFLSGGTLAAVLGQPLPARRALELSRPIADALDYAHARGMVHRDVKPSNILFDDRGHPVLTDFGVARMVAGTTRLTATGAAVGTPEYMAPEQAAGETTSPASDQYALGIVLYEMLTGRTPFQAETPVAVALAHMHKPLPLPRSLNPDLLESVEAVLLKVLAKDPADRYASCLTLAEALERALANPTAPTLSDAVALPAAPPVVVPLAGTTIIPAPGAAPPKEAADITTPEPGAAPAAPARPPAATAAAGEPPVPTATAAAGPPPIGQPAARGRPIWPALLGAAVLGAILVLAGLGLFAGRGPFGGLGGGRGERQTAQQEGGKPGLKPGSGVPATGQKPEPAATAAPAAAAPAPAPPTLTPAVSASGGPASASPQASGGPAASPGAPARPDLLRPGQKLGEAAKPGLPRPGVLAGPLVEEVAALAGRQLAEDTFDNPSAGLFAPTGVAGTELAYEAGELVLQLRRPPAEAPSFVAPARQPTSFSNGVIDTGAAPVGSVEATAWGVQLRHSPTARTGYQVLVIPQRRLLLLARLEGQESRILTRVNSEAIQNGSNRLTVAAIGPELRAWVNGQPLLTARDPSFADGRVGLVVGIPQDAPQPEAKVAFSHFRVFQAK